MYFHGAQYKMMLLCMPTILPFEQVITEKFSDCDYLSCDKDGYMYTGREGRTWTQHKPCIYIFYYICPTYAKYFVLYYVDRAFQYKLRQ